MDSFLMEIGFLDTVMKFPRARITFLRHCEVEEMLECNRHQQSPDGSTLCSYFLGGAAAVAAWNTAQVVLEALILSQAVEARHSQPIMVMKYALNRMPAEDKSMVGSCPSGWDLEITMAIAATDLSCSGRSCCGTKVELERFC